MSEELAASRMVKYIAHVLYELDNRIWHAGMLEVLPDVDDNIDFILPEKYLKVAHVIVNNTLNIWLSEIRKDKESTND